MPSRGILSGVRPMPHVPDWMGGGDPNNDGSVLTFDSSQPGGAKPAPSGTTAHGCIATNSTANSIPSGTDTAVTLDTNQWDSDGYHSTVTNTTRITIPTGRHGVYQISAAWAFVEATSSVGHPAGYVRVNGGSRRPIEADYSAISTGINPRFSISGLWKFADGDYFELLVAQDSGTTWTLESDAFLLPTLSCIQVASV